MDIDLDFPPSFSPEDYFEVVRASMVRDGKIVKHNVGVYFQRIPKASVSGFSAVPYKQAEQLGFFKIDFLHLTILENFNTKDQIRKLIKIPPDWSLLRIPSVVQKLFQLSKHYDVIQRIQPKSIQELADTIALIRPAKRYLLDAYLKDRDVIRPELFRKPDEGGRDGHQTKNRDSQPGSVREVDPG